MALSRLAEQRASSDNWDKAIKGGPINCGWYNCPQMP